ncbi:MAG: 50S ribosomal protein L1 [Berkelbacteria bacterium GW2011_GWB1_38_5]|uniref:Ribosomal protein n=2 Tax=Candidatus Berkelbacteria TaxID=1618330 RepID=A0A0G0FGF3_9BACT|nr:MAG: 50S ribosomal protein L1 [Berkelbacteria bacterium GW2011_GWA1_36_9]KKQ73624.1 MAG: 50S ribosomal protein L1 [Berkelbacteria bacterium GW2011_GWB1_38_5]
MGTQRPVVIGEELTEELGGPISEHHGKKKEEKSKKKDVQEQIKEARYKKNEEMEDKETVEAKSTEGDILKPKKVKIGKAKTRSKKYKEAHELIDPKKIYDFSEAVELVKKTSLSKFDGNVELHARLLAKNGKPETLRGTLKYPHLTGKKITVIILDEAKIAEILETKKIDFDIALATPALMAQVGKLARILGPKGKMPNPKSGTITADPEKTKKELEEGMTEYKTDSYGIIHQIIGKVSADPKILEENFRAILAVLPKEKITSLHICATIGPSVKVKCVKFK